MSTLAIPQLVALNGVYPAFGGGWPVYFTTGMIQTYAGAGEIFGAPPARGQLVSVQQLPMLYSIFGSAYGGNGPTQFALPNLDQRSVVGGQRVGLQGQGTLTMTYMIAVEAAGMAPFVGAVVAFGGSRIPEGWLPADGSLLQIDACNGLFGAIGNRFGGDGETNFALPNLNGAAAVGTGAGVVLGQKLSGPVPGLGLNYAICAGGGIYPSPGGNGSFPDNEPFLGQVLACAAMQLPKGWMACDGALLDARQNPALFSLLGYAYGGSGPTFALPDLRGKMIVGGTAGAQAAEAPQMPMPTA
ncbi:MAG TPA: phage tail protein [Sphingomonas sp.]|nr:phage tail protein [Sphingomonas sp.]